MKLMSTATAISRAKRIGLLGFEFYGGFKQGFSFLNYQPNDSNWNRFIWFEFVIETVCFEVLADWYGQSGFLLVFILATK